MSCDIAVSGIERDRLSAERLNNIVRLFRHGACPNGNMRLTVLQPKQPIPGQISQPNVRVFALKLAQRRHHRVRHAAQAGHHQFTGNTAALALYPVRQLAELIVCRLRHATQIKPGLCCRVTPRVALKQLDPQPCFQRSNVA